MVCNPNNPTGAVLTEGEMEAVVEVAARADAWIVADEIYRGAEVDTDVTSPTFWGRYDKVIVTSGLSKAFGMPGLRSGWVVAPPEMIRKVWIRHDYTTLTPNMISDILTGFSMQPDVRESIFARTRGIIRANLPPLEEWIAAQGELLTYVRPVAGAIAYVKYGLPIRSTRLVDRIREEQSVLLVSGDMFGVGKGFRIGFGFDVEQTLKGLERVATVLADLAAGGGGPDRRARGPARRPWARHCPSPRCRRRSVSRSRRSARGSAATTSPPRAGHGANIAATHNTRSTCSGSFVTRSPGVIRRGRLSSWS